MVKRTAFVPEWRGERLEERTMLSLTAPPLPPPSPIPSPYTVSMVWPISFPASVKVAWQKVAIATGYAVEVYYGGVWNQYGGEVAPNVLSEVVTGLNPGTTYYFDVLWYSGQNAIREEVIPFAVPSLPIFNSGVMHPVAPGNYQAVDGVLFGSGGPKYADVQQNTLGDCWLLASLAETAAKDPALITNMFTYLGWWSENGVPTQLYDVRLNEYSVQGSIAYGTGVVCTELVDTEFDVYQGQFYGASIFGGIEWVALAEKAYVQAASQGYVLNSYGKTNAPCPDNYGDVVGGSPEWALAALTGGVVEYTAIDVNEINTVMATTDGMAVLQTSDPVDPMLVPDHCFAVIADQTTNQALPQFTLFNPWNRGSIYNGYYGSMVYCDATYLSQNFVVVNISG